MHALMSANDPKRTGCNDAEWGRRNCRRNGAMLYAGFSLMSLFFNDRK
jgi:hypothetical protein